MRSRLNSSRAAAAVKSRGEGLRPDCVHIAPLPLSPRHTAQLRTYNCSPSTILGGRVFLAPAPVMKVARMRSTTAAISSSVRRVSKASIAVPGRPCVTELIMRSRLNSRRDTALVKSRGGVVRPRRRRVLPSPCSPWQTTQNSAYTVLPSAADADCGAAASTAMIMNAVSAAKSLFISTVVTCCELNSLTCSVARRSAQGAERAGGKAAIVAQINPVRYSWAFHNNGRGLGLTTSGILHSVAHQEQDYRSTHRARLGRCGLCAGLCAAIGARLVANYALAGTLLGTKHDFLGLYDRVGVKAMGGLAFSEYDTSCVYCHLPPERPEANSAARGGGPGGGRGGPAAGAGGAGGARARGGRGRAPSPGS